MFGVVHMDGSGDDDPPVESLSDLFDELWFSGIVDGSVAVINDDLGWCMSAHRDGRLILENLGDLDRKSEDRMHMMPVPKTQVLDLWKRLIEGNLEGLLSEPWKRGYG
jgi:hypothetical protein